MTHEFVAKDQTQFNLNKLKIQVKEYEKFKNNSYDKLLVRSKIKKIYLNFLKSINQDCLIKDGTRYFIKEKGSWFELIWTS